jgi:hypothetical protein
MEGAHLCSPINYHRYFPRFLLLLLSMSFLAPLYLFGLFALAIPIVIHLFSFRRTKRVFFSSNRFIRQVQEATSSKKRLKHYLILAARLLFVGFLVLAFAQPFLPAGEQDLTGKEVIIYLDNSLSMSNEVDTDLTALEAGIQLTQQVLEVYPRGTRFRLLTNDFAPYSNTSKSSEEINELLSTLHHAGTSRSFEEVHRRLLSGLDRGQASRTDVFWVSDFPRSHPPKAEILDSLLTYRLVPMRYSGEANVYVDSVYLENPLYGRSEKFTLKVHLRNTGSREVQDVQIRILLNEIQSAGITATIPAKGTAVLSFDLSPPQEETVRGKVVFEDFPVTFDNEFYFVLPTSRKIRVLEIKESTPPTSIERVYANPALFEFVSYSVNNLNYGLIAEVDLVVINALQELPLSLTTALNARLSKGGHVMIVPASQAVLSSYALAGMRRLQPADSSGREPLTAPDFANPFFAGIFEDSNPSMAMPEARAVIDWGQDRTALLQFRNGKPFLSTFAEGKGFLLATPLSDAFSGFQRHALFVPVMYRIAQGSLSAAQHLYYNMDEPVVSLRADSLGQNTLVRLVHEATELVPPQQKSGTTLTLQSVGLVHLPGFYTAKSDNLVLGELAYNYTSEESKMDQLLTQELKDLLVAKPNVRLLEGESPEGITDALRAQYLGTPLWKWMLVLALGCLLAEALFIRFIKG